MSPLSDFYDLHIGDLCRIPYSSQLKEDKLAGWMGEHKMDQDERRDA